MIYECLGRVGRGKKLDVRKINGWRIQKSIKCNFTNKENQMKIKRVHDRAIMRPKISLLLPSQQFFFCSSNPQWQLNHQNHIGQKYSLLTLVFQNLLSFKFSCAISTQVKYLSVSVEGVACPLLIIFSQVMLHG